MVTIIGDGASDGITVRIGTITTIIGTRHTATIRIGTITTDITDTMATTIAITTRGTTTTTRLTPITVIAHTTITTMWRTTVATATMTTTPMAADAQRHRAYHQAETTATALTTLEPLHALQQSTDKHVQADKQPLGDASHNRKKA